MRTEFKKGSTLSYTIKITLIFCMLSGNVFADVYSSSESHLQGTRETYSGYGDTFSEAVAQPYNYLNYASSYIEPVSLTGNSQNTLHGGVLVRTYAPNGFSINEARTSTNYGETWSLSCPTGNCMVTGDAVQYASPAGKGDIQLKLQQTGSFSLDSNAVLGVDYKFIGGYGTLEFIFNLSQDGDGFNNVKADATIYKYSKIGNQLLDTIAVPVSLLINSDGNVEFLYNQSYNLYAGKNFLEELTVSASVGSRQNMNSFVDSYESFFASIDSLDPNVKYVSDSGRVTGSSDSENTPVPEPSTFLLLGAGLAGFGFWRRKQNNSLSENFTLSKRGHPAGWSFSFWANIL